MAKPCELRLGEDVSIFVETTKFLYAARLNQKGQSIVESPIITKLCKKCERDLPLEKFYRDPTRSDGRSFYCGECRKKSDSIGPAGERRRQQQREAYRAARKILQDIKNKPCMDCGGSFPWYCMDFDHPDPSKKKYNISYWCSSRRVKEMLEEITQCHLVCACCHRMRTYVQYKAGLIKAGRPRKYFDPPVDEVSEG